MKSKGVSEATNNLEIVLNSVPQKLYDLAQDDDDQDVDPDFRNTRIWVRLTIYFKDLSSGTIGSKDLTAMVELAPPPLSSSKVSGDIPTWLILAIVVGFAVTISSLFLCTVVAYKKKMFCWKSSSSQGRINEKKNLKKANSIRTSIAKTANGNTNASSSAMGDFIEETENDVTMTCFDGDHVYGDAVHHNGGFDGEKSLGRILEEI